MVSTSGLQLYGNVTCITRYHLNLYRTDCCFKADVEAMRRKQEIAYRVGQRTLPPIVS